MVLKYGKNITQTHKIMFLFYIFHQSCHVNLVKRSKPDNFDLIINCAFPKDLKWYHYIIWFNNNHVFCYINVFWYTITKHLFWNAIFLILFSWASNSWSFHTKKSRKATIRRTWWLQLWFIRHLSSYWVWW